MPRPTVHDIASKAGVSLATVDRVLNSRPGVRAKTIDKVNAAISEIGYVRDVAAANLARQRDYRFVFVIPKGESWFLRQLENVIDEARHRVISQRIQVETVRVDADNPHALVAMLDHFGYHRVDGIAVMAPETPQLRDAITHLRQEGITVLALLSDLPNSAVDDFVGIDNVAAGRTAAALIGRFMGETSARDILVIAGSMLARDHIDRRLGFDQTIQAMFPKLRVLPTLEAWNDANVIAKRLPALLAANRQIGGIYSVGGGNSGVIDVLAKQGRGDVTVIAHDLTPITQHGLLSGVIDALIVQDLGHAARSAVRLMRARRDREPVLQAQERIRLEIIIKENLPEEGGQIHLEERQ
ncbi:MAG: LacI family DNA-binding transcriptional regulator [Ahrensia sp.]|nr:LacI family DNA-binding transcriptional regulator [Ahrensia sp.]